MKYNQNMEISFISGKFLMVQQSLAVMKLSHHIFSFISTKIWHIHYM